MREESRSTGVWLLMILRPLYLTSLLGLASLACAQGDQPTVPSLLRGMEPDLEEIDMRRTPVVRAVERARDSVVSIYIARDGKTLAHGIDGQGSGVVIDEAGLVITNWHVVAPLANTRGGLVARFHNGTSYPADVLSSSPDHDLALLQLRTDQPLKAIVAGDSDSLMVGETVIAIGNAQGNSDSVTVGVLSSTDRSIRVRTPDGRARSYEGLLQTDAAINQGNSGGALLDITGKLIGINNAMAVGVENIGYAIPISTVRRVFEEVLVSSENLASIWFGLRVTDRDGAPVVSAVAPAGPAARAGVQVGDRIVRAGGRQVRSALDYARATIRAETGVPFELEVARDERLESLSVEPMSRTAWELMRRTGLEVARVTAEQDRKLLEAASLELYSDSRRRRVQLLPAALRVERVLDNSPAAKLGLRRGDLLIAASVPAMFGRWSYRPLLSVEDLATIVRDRAGRSVNLLLLRDGEGLEGPLPVDTL